MIQQAFEIPMVQPAGARTLSIAGEEIKRATGPYSRDHLNYVAVWWEWLLGSTPFFWNWPSQYQEEARDGQPHYRLDSDVEPFRVPQQAPLTKRDGELVAAKVIPVRKRRSIDVGLVLSLIHYFYVPKGLDDVRMVYNGTGSGLNDTLWAPHFGLPNVKHTARSLMPGYY